MAEIVLAVDPGEARIGLAVCDPSGTVARPYKVIAHKSRHEDAKAIIAHAEELAAVKILVGVALDEDGRIGPQARKGLRMADQLRELTQIPVETWDESGSTEMARKVSPSRSALDARAAAVILQDYLDAEK
jgi:putative Holliday junction resolvase